MEQYAAVASVMRRGLAWHLAAVSLIGRGHLPTREATFRSAFEQFFAQSAFDCEDSFDRAEQLAKEARSTTASGVRQLVRAMDTNFRRAKVKNPLTGRFVPPEEGVNSVLTNMALMALGGQSLDNETGLRVAAAQGLLTQLPTRFHEEAGRLVADIYNDLLCFSSLRETALNVEPTELQRAVLQVREVFAKVARSGFVLLPRLPTVFWDVVCALLGLAIVGLDRRGGMDVFVNRHQSAFEAVATSLDHLSATYLTGPKEYLFTGGYRK